MKIDNSNTKNRYHPKGRCLFFSEKKTCKKELLYKVVCREKSGRNSGCLFYTGNKKRLTDSGFCGGPESVSL